MSMMSCRIQDLPRACLASILAHCDCDDTRLSLRSVCRGFRHAFDGESSLQCCLWAERVQTSQLVALSEVSEGTTTLLLPHCLQSCSLGGSGLHATRSVQLRDAGVGTVQLFSSLQHLVVNYRISSLLRELAEAAGSSISSVTITKGRGGTRRAHKLCKMLHQLQQLPQLRHLHLTFRLPPAAAELVGQLQQLQSLRLSIPVSTTSSSNSFKHASAQGFPPQLWQLAVSPLTALTRLQCTLALQVDQQHGLPLQQLQQLRCLELHLLQAHIDNVDHQSGIHAADNLLSNLAILPHLTKLSLVAESKLNWIMEAQQLSPAAFERLGLLRQLQSLELGLAHWQMSLHELQPLSACRHLTELVLPELVMNFAHPDQNEQYMPQLTSEELAAVAAGLAAAAAAAAGAGGLELDGAAGSIAGPAGQVSSVTVMGSSRQVPLLPGLKRLVCSTMWWRLPLVVVAPALSDVGYKRLRNLGRGSYVLQDIQHLQDVPGGGMFLDVMQELMNDFDFMALLDNIGMQEQDAAVDVVELPAGHPAAPADDLVPDGLAGQAAAGAPAEAEMLPPHPPPPADSQQPAGSSDAPLHQAPDPVVSTSGTSSSIVIEPAAGCAAGASSSSAAAPAAVLSAAAAPPPPPEFAANEEQLGCVDGASALLSATMPGLGGAGRLTADDNDNTAAGTASGTAWATDVKQQQELQHMSLDAPDLACRQVAADLAGASSSAAAEAAAAAAVAAAATAEAAAAAAEAAAAVAAANLAADLSHHCDHREEGVHSLSCPLPCPVPDADQEAPFSATAAGAAEPVMPVEGTAGASSDGALDPAEAMQDEAAPPTSAAAAAPAVAAACSLQEAPMSKCYADVLKGQASLRKLDVCVPSLCKIVQLTSRPLASLQELSLHMLGAVRLPPAGLPFLPCLTRLEFYLPEDCSWEDKYNDDEDVALWQHQHSVKHIIVRGTYHGGGFFAPNHLTLAAAVMPKLQVFRFVNCRDLRVEKLQRVVDSKVAPAVEVVMPGKPPDTSCSSKTDTTAVTGSSTSSSQCLPQQLQQLNAAEHASGTAGADSAVVAAGSTAAAPAASSSALSNLGRALCGVGSSTEQFCQSECRASVEQSTALCDDSHLSGRTNPVVMFQPGDVVTKVIVQAMARSASAAGPSVRLRWIDDPVAWAPWLLQLS